MYPSKNMVDFVDDINKLFLRTESNDRDVPFYSSPFQAPSHRSSSSTDSFSPESYVDVFRQSNIRPETPRNIFESSSFDSLNTSPFDLSNIFERNYDNFHLDSQKNNYAPIFESPTSSLNLQSRQQRPIVGRKILGSRPKTEPIKDEIENLFNTDEIHKSYELFPSEKKGYEFHTPVKANPVSVNSISPRNSNIYSPRLNYSPQATDFKPFAPISTASSSNGDRGSKICTFCRKNGETPMVYMTHCVKEKIGNRHIVTCPILRSHECKTCGASGDNAHTLTYCPVLRSSNNGKPLQSTTITLKNTRIKSNGRRRY